MMNKEEYAEALAAEIQEKQVKRMQANGKNLDGPEGGGGDGEGDDEHPHYDASQVQQRGYYGYFGMGQNPYAIHEPNYGRIVPQ